MCPSKFFYSIIIPLVLSYTHKALPYDYLQVHIQCFDRDFLKLIAMKFHAIQLHVI